MDRTQSIRFVFLVLFFITAMLGCRQIIDSIAKDMQNEQSILYSPTVEAINYFDSLESRESVMPSMTDYSGEQFARPDMGYGFSVGAGNMGLGYRIGNSNFGISFGDGKIIFMP